MPPRIPTPQDFSPSPFPPNSLTLTYPNPPESTTSILLLFHGLGDTHAPFASFARNLALPGVLAIAVRGVNPLPAALFPPSPSPTEGGGGEAGGYHWGDDLRIGGSAGGEGLGLDADPGFNKAKGWIMDRLIGEVLVGKCGWSFGDVMLFGFGQGGSLALGLAAGVGKGRVRVEEVQVEVGGGLGAEGAVFKGVVSVGGALPASMVPSFSAREKAKTPVLVCCGRESEAVDEDAVEVLEREFEQVKVVRWKRASDGMPSNREEALPMMQFFAERLRSGWL
ncbi:alpha/beta-hydrolase [Canariomyces notabilis]|uniref:Alpha/beta-hydrolase n=1 Tax=Canariomyces notabilis TaxID=2074819 RepID=A0AAN6TH74_9PEZI|nr:alpha/beta-hydrolase [Canariomyces arenarius]